MTGQGACLACRERKVKCVQSPTQRCERCTRQGIKDCIYEGIKKRGIGKTLRMREACVRCRLRKRKCDAKRPCTTCVEANSARECEYQVIVTRPRLSGHTQFTFLIDPGPSSSTHVTAQEHCAVGQVVQPLPTKTPVVISTRSRPKPAPPARALIHSVGPYNSQQTFPPPAGPRSHSLNQVGRRDSTLPHLSVLPSLVFPTIPPEPYVNLSFMCPERFQLSDTAQDQLDMKFRLCVIIKLGKLGMRFTPEKQQALLDGDTSGTVIHPFFILAAQSLGMHLCEEVGNSPAMITLYAKYVQTALELLTEVFREVAEKCDWELQAQVTLWITFGSIVMRLSKITSTYLKKSCEAINRGGLQFIPTYGRPPTFSHELHEKLSVLSQAIYYENFLLLTCGGTQPTTTSRIEKEFRHKLQETYPVLFVICPLTMRTKSILLVRDTVVILSIRPTLAEEVRLEFWRRSCDDLVADLDHYSQSLLLNLQRFRSLGDKNGSGVIQSSCINCLAHLAVLCEALCQMGSPRGELYTLCDSALERLSELTQDMRAEEYTRLDLLLGLSWKKALGVFDSRIANSDLEHRTRLGRWKEAVVEVHSDFVAKMPDDEPPIFTERAHKLDGRTEESRYPNLMLPWVQQRYGL